MTQPLSAASPQTSEVQLFVPGLSFVFLGILSFFSAFTSADYHSKIYRNSWPVLPLLQQAKHFNKTYMYFNLLLIVSAADKKIIKKTTKDKYTLFNISFHVYSVKIISMLSDRQALITGQLQTSFAAVLIVPPVKLLVLCFNQTRICLFERHTHGLQSSIAATNSTGNNSNFITSISWKDGYARQGGSLEGSNVAF